MKKYFLPMLLIVQLLFGTKIYAQNIAINATGGLPDGSAMLDISSTNKGFLAPRMTTTQQNAIPLPAAGLLLFNTTDNVFKVNTGTPASPIWTPLLFSGGSGSISSVNGLTNTTQLFATGTTGSDFGINSTGSTHTFNIPTASATNRGALSAADWTTFNGKQTALGFTPYNATNPSGYISSSSIAGATDATITTPANGQLLQYNISTGKWVNTTPSFLSSYTETDPVVKAINGIVKSNGTTISAAVAGTDYVTPSGSITGNAATVTTNANLTGPITSIGNATSIASQTGTGSTFVMSASPTLTGTPLAPTAIAGTNTTQIATTAFVTAAVSGGTTTNFTGNLAGDVTGTQSATVVGKINGTALSGLGTGILKNTTATGVPSIAVAGTDYLTPTGNGSALTGITESQVTNLTADLALKAPLASPTLTGTPLAPTAIAGTNTTQLATTAFVTNAVSGGTTTNFSGNLAGEVTGTQSSTVVGNAAVIAKTLTGYTSTPGTVSSADNILGAIQKINGNDVLKAPLASPTLTGTPLAPTAIAGTNTTQLATTAFVTNAVSGGTTTNFSGNLAGEVTGTQSSTVVGNAAVIGKVLTGYTSVAGTVAATDNILQAIQKINGNDALKAPLASPTLTGTPIAPTAIAGTNTTQIATTAFVTAAVIGGTTTNFSGSLAGDVTGTQSATVVGKINGTSLAGLGTGILKNTTGTGVPSIAVAADFPTLNQNTTGTAANVTGTVAVANGGTGQVSTLTAGGLVYGSTSTAMAVTGAGTSGQVLQSTGALAPVWVNGGTMMLSGNSNNTSETTLAGSINNYYPIVGTLSTMTTSDAVAGTRTLMSRNGTIKNLYVKLSGPAGGNKNIIVTVYLNGNPETLSVTITGGSAINNISGQDLLHPFTVVAGDEVGIVISSTNTPNHQKVSWSADFTY